VVSFDTIYGQIPPPLMHACTLCKLQLIHNIFVISLFLFSLSLLCFSPFLSHRRLSMRSHNWVKSFILGCIILLQSDATGSVHDSVNCFYDTLCAEMNTTIFDETLSMDLMSRLCFGDSPHFEIGGILEILIDNVKSVDACSLKLYNREQNMNLQRQK
jgi:hypothetical protein